MNIPQHRDYWPTRDWKIKMPQETNLHPEPLAQLEAYAQKTDILRSVLIVRSGYIAFENYYHGWTQNNYQNVNSVTKSVTSALVGIALREGYLKSVDQPLLDFFPEYRPHNLDPRKQTITLRHLLSMSSGYQVAPRDVETFLEDTTSVEKMLDRPLQHNPGEVFGYDDVSCHFLSLILQRVTQVSLARYAQTRLFDPLGIWHDEQEISSPWLTGARHADSPHPFALWNLQEKDILWSVDSQGYYPAGLGLQLTTREMAAFGFLYLNHGRWNGQEIVAENYVQESLHQHSVTIRGEPYGYLWYVPLWNGHPSFMAIGFGGQLIAVFPDLDTIVVTTFRPEPGPSPSRTLMNDFLVPAIMTK